MSGNKTEVEKNYLNDQKGIKSWLLTLDHKRIGILYLYSIMFFFFIGGMSALLIRLELIRPQEVIVGADTYNQLFTLHGAIMILSLIHISEPTRPY